LSEIHPRLFLITPPLIDGAAFGPALGAALAGGRIDCLLIKTAATDERQLKRIVQDLAPMAVEAGAAILIDAPEDLRVAARIGADGVHLSYQRNRLKSAIEAMKPDRIVGVSGLKLRDDAMQAGEMDVDYVMFGEPYPDGMLPPFPAVLERVSWWAEIFATPCVAYAPRLEDIRLLSEAKAEFIALEAAIWHAAEGPEQSVAAALAIIRSTLAA